MAGGGENPVTDRTLPQVSGLTPEVRQHLNAYGVTDFGMTTTDDHQAFCDALEAAKASSRNGASVDSKTVEKLQGAVTFMSPDGMAGGAVERGKGRGGPICILR